MQIEPQVRTKPTKPSHPVRRCCIMREPRCPLPRCGLYIANPDMVKEYKCSVSIPLKHIDYEVQIVDNIAYISLTQSYENPLDTNLQLQYSFPVNPKVCFNSFRAKFGTVAIEGRVKEKHQARQEYTKGLKQGRQVVYAEIDEQSHDIVNLKIGNVRPKEKVEIKVTLLQMLEVSLNTFWRLMISSTISPRYLNEALPPAEFNSSTKEIELTEPPNYTWSFKVSVRSSKPITSCKSTTHDLLQLSLSQEKKETMLVMEESCRPNRDFVFQYSVKDFEQPGCVIGRTDAGSSALVSFIPKFCDLTVDDALKSQLAGKQLEFDMESARAQYLFLLDRSGSMSGLRMEKAKQALIFFLRSLPQRSYFDVYSFGNSYLAMFGKSRKYDNSSLKKAVDEIEHMTANMGGTNIGSALQAIFNSPVIEGFPKQIFLLTDGAVSNTQSIIQLVGQHTKFCRVHTIGIGNGASPALIEGCAEKGKGRHIFIQDDANVSGRIIELLSAALSPVISDLSVSFDESVVESVTPNPRSMPYVLKDEPVSLFFILRHGFEGETRVKLHYSLEQREFEKEVTINNTGTNTVPWVDRMAHHTTLQIMCGKLSDEKALGQEMLLAKVGNLSEVIVRDSVKHQIMCPLTAYVCIGKDLSDAERQLFQTGDTLKIVVPQHEPKEEKMIMLSKPGKHGAAKMVSASRMYAGVVSSPLAPAARQPVAERQFKERAKKKTTVARSSAVNNEMNVRRMSKRKRQSCQEEQEEDDSMDYCQQKDKDQKPSSPLEQLLQLQHTDGNWDCSAASKKLIAATVKIEEGILDDLALKFKSPTLVLTAIVAAWLEKHHNLPEYQLLLRKAKGWVSKFVKEKQLDPQAVQQIQALVV